LSLALNHWFFTKLLLLDLEKNHELLVFWSFFSLLTDIHLIFGTLICHTKIQINFEFGFDPLIFHEFMALVLKKISRIIYIRFRKISRIISFLDFFSLC
jgi:hypothetical protein